MYTNGSLYTCTDFQCSGTRLVEVLSKKKKKKTPWYYKFWIGKINRFRVHRIIQLTSIITSTFYNFYWTDSTWGTQYDSQFKSWVSCRDMDLQLIRTCFKYNLPLSLISTLIFCLCFTFTVFKHQVITIRYHLFFDDNDAVLKSLVATRRAVEKLLAFLFDFNN